MTRHSPEDAIRVALKERAAAALISTTRRRWTIIRRCGA
jgi:hypothetical protein